MERIAEGDLSVRFNIRKNDELQALPAILNDAVGSFRNSVSRMKREIPEIEAALEKGDALEAKKRFAALKAIVLKFTT